MTLYFKSNATGSSSSGLNLTVTLIPVEYTISDEKLLCAIFGQGVVASKSTGYVGDTVYLTAKTDVEDYILNKFNVKDANKNVVPVIRNTLTEAFFVMPASNVQVSSGSFDSDISADKGFHLDLARNAKIEIDLPSGVKSFNLYDEGGAHGNYSNKSNDTLVITAPVGYHFKMTGKIYTENNNNDKLSVYDGSSTTATSLFARGSATTGVAYDVGTIVTSSNSMTVYFHSDGSIVSSGLDLLVSIVPDSYSISIVQVDNGSVSSKTKTAIADETVTLMVNSAEGYYLSGCTVLSNANGSITSSYNSADNTVSFTMPASPVTITPVFTSVPSINVISVSGGHVQDKMALADGFKLNATLSATPDDGFAFNGASVVDADGKTVKVYKDSAWYSNVATFNLTKNVTVTPEFVKELSAADGIFVNMPYEGSTRINIPMAVKSFNVYDDGGISGYNSRGANGTVVLHAPNGYLLHVETTSMNTNANSHLIVYDGEDVDDAKTLLDVSGTEVGSINSSGNSITIHFESSKRTKGFEILVTLIRLGVEIAEVTGGSMTSDKDVASPGETVTLTATPDEGYLFDGVSVEDKDGNEIALSKDIHWYSGASENAVTFNMPANAVTVTPKFSAVNNLYVNMPKSGTTEITIPEGVGSFKVYDEGGVNGAYSNNSDGSIVFTAPTGYLLKLTGTVIAERNYDKLYVYNGSAVNENNLLATIPGKATGSSVNEKADVGIIVSSGERMTVRFTSDGSQYYSGLNLTMTLVKSIASMTVANVSSQTYTGTAICPDVVVKDVDAVLVKNTDYTVTCSDNINVGTATVTITGIGDYTGTVSKQFTIIPKVVNDFAAVTIEQDENGTFAVIDGNYSGTDVVEIKNEIKDVPVVYNRSFPANAYSTIMLPFDVNTANIEGPDAVLRYNGIKDNSSIRMKVVWATEEWALANGITGKSYAHTDLSANTPYLVQMGDATSEDGKTVALKVNGTVTIKKTTDPDVTLDKWTFRGTWQYKRWDANDDELGYAYGFAASASETNNIKVGDFVKVGVGAWIRPMRAYLVKDGITKKSAQLARANGAYVKRPTVVPEELPELMSIVIDSDDGNEERTTVIGHFNTRTGEIKMNYDRGKFDLNGRRVNGSNNARGAYYGKKATVRRPER